MSSSSSSNAVAKTVAKIFGQSFHQMTSSSDQLELQSDSDSDTEERRKEQKKRDKKRKNKAPRKKPRLQSSFTVHQNILPTSVAVNEKSHPEILCVEMKFDPDTDQKEQLIAATKFFNKRNSSNLNFKDIPPWEWPIIRDLLQTKPDPSFDIHAQNDRGQSRPKMEGVTRSHEELYLIEPQFDKGHRQCLYDELCQGLKICDGKDGKAGFVCREFFLKSEEAKIKETGKLPPGRRLCIMCRRYEIMRALLNTRADNLAVKKGITLQDYFNFTDVDGEYKSESCICSDTNTFEGLLEPVVMHNLSAYRLKVKDGTTKGELKEHFGLRYYDQWQMSKPESEQSFQ